MHPDLRHQRHRGAGLTPRLLLLAALAAVSLPSLAFGNTGAYSHDSWAKTSNPRWMTPLDNDLLLSELSIPGTHNTMASKAGGDIALNQSMSLTAQLQSGIRVLDIRVREHVGRLGLYHGISFQEGHFDTDVLGPVTQFLASNPGETVFMRIDKEGGRLYPTYDTSPERNVGEMVHEYLNVYSARWWRGTSNNPTLGELRGKFVVLQHSSLDYATRLGIPYNTVECEDSPATCEAGIDGRFASQDKDELASNWDLYEKWEKVKRQLDRANKGPWATKYINYLSGSTGSFPYFVASGQSSPGTSDPLLLTGRTTPGWADSWPDFPRLGCIPIVYPWPPWSSDICSIAFAGTNLLARDRIGRDYRQRVGIVMADFPGPELIERIISLNGPYKASWAPGEPNNSGGEEHCAMMWSHPEGTWNDGRCSGQARFACLDRATGAWSLSASAGPWNASTPCPPGTTFEVPRTPAQNEALMAAKMAAGAPAVWLNFSDLDTEGTWRSTYDVSGAPTFWAPGEPNNVGGKEDCVVMWSSPEGTWNDGDCRGEAPFACYNRVTRQWSFTARGTWNALPQCPEGSIFHVPRTLAQNDALKAAKIAAGVSHVWLNYTDLGQEGTFRSVWEVPDAPNWDVGEPDGQRTQNCGHMFPNGTWHDVGCDANVSKFACQGDQLPLDWRISSEAGIWSASPGKCPAGTHFSVPRNAIENGRLIRAKQAAGVSELWLNYNDEHIEGNWTDSRQSPFWAPGEPNGARAENCAEMRSDGQWNDRECYPRSQPFACRNDQSPLEWDISVSYDYWGRYAGKCPSGTHFSVPRNSVENLALLQEMQAQGVSSVWLNSHDMGEEGVWTNDERSIYSCRSFSVGFKLPSGQTWRSCDGRFHLTMQTDGNLVLYQVAPGQPMYLGQPIWQTHTAGNNGASLTFQDDGNLVLRTTQNVPIWSTGTSGKRSASLAIQNDGTLVISFDNMPIWASNFYRTDWEPLGGGMTGNPSVISWDASHLDVYVRGPDNALHHRWWFGSTGWSDWQSMGGTLTSDPAAVSWGSGHVDVYVRGADNALWHRWFNNGSWSGWESLGGLQFVGKPTVVSWGPGHLDVYVRGTDNALWHRWFTKGSWSGWESLGGQVAGNPAVVSSGPGHLEVFVRGTDTGLWRRGYGSTGWSGWQDLRGLLSSDPAAVAGAGGRVDVFARQPDGVLLHRTLLAGSWSAWNGLGEGLLEGPTVASWNPGTLDVYARGTGNTLMHLRYNNNVWSKGTQLRVGMTSSPAVMGWTNGRRDIFFRAPDGTLQHGVYALP